MKPADVIAFGAISALGVGRAAFSVGAAEERPATAVRRDDEFSALGLKRPFAARAQIPEGESIALDRAERLLELAARKLVAELDPIDPGWRGRRVGWAVGTSGGGMPSLLRAFEQRAQGIPIEPALARAAPYFGPLTVLERVLGIDPVRRTQVLAACASSTFAVGLGCRWLDTGQADLVIAGGYDALSVFIAAGFEALGATSSGPPQPFRVERDGMAIGEGAALLALVPSAPERRAPLGRVWGFGASSDAIHVTAPDPKGEGLARAAQRALEDAAVPADHVELVSAHGTATPFNDAAETRAIVRVLGSGAARAVVHPFKSVIGHALGAGGALEALAALDAMQRGVLPAAAGSGAVAPEVQGRLLERNRSGTIGRCLKLSSAFGGVNAALLLGSAAATPAGATAERCGAPVAVWSVGRAELSLDVGAVAPYVRADGSKLARLDPLSGAAVAAAASAIARLGRPLPEVTGVVLGSATSTLEIDDAFDARRRKRGPRAVEPRRFPPTSPNLACGQCSIAFGLKGPSLAVGAGPAAGIEALEVALDLIEAGDAQAVVVVAAEGTGPVVRELWASAGFPLPREGARALVVGPVSAAEPGVVRSKIATAHARARAGRGRLDGAEPGWPSLWAALGLEQS